MTRQKRKKVDSSVEMSNNSLFGDDASANSTQNDKNPTSELIQKYKDMDNPTNNDLKELLIASLQAQTRTSDQISSIKHNLKATKGIVEENSSRIAVLEQNLAHLELDRCSTPILVCHTDPYTLIHGPTN